MLSRVLPVLGRIIYRPIGLDLSELDDD